MIWIYILLIHFLADFSLQTHQQATMKSQSVKYLVYHTGVYSLIWLIASYIVFDDVLKAIWFALITFVLHTITDYITSRIGKPFWNKQDFHNGFVVIGFDQIFHYLQLYITFVILY